MFNCYLICLSDDCEIADMYVPTHEQSSTVHVALLKAP